MATFRFVHVQLMEMLAQWTPTTPEMEVKLLFGEHIWNVAQHADALGKRANELRLPMQHSKAPVDAYVGLLAEIRQESGTGRRIGAFYDALLPGLASRYREYLERTDALMDAPTVRILEQMSESEARMVRQSRDLRKGLPAIAGTDEHWIKGLAAKESQIAGLVAPRAS